MFRPTLRIVPLLSLWVVLSTAAWAAEALPKVTVYKSPTCGCCGKWISHLRENGFTVEGVDMENLRWVKRISGIGPQEQSCHTARVGSYVIEGHVPAEDIKRLLAEKPDATGLTVPGMPQGSPGMESPRPEHYEVLLLKKDGSTEVFARH